MSRLARRSLLPLLIALVGVAAPWAAAMAAAMAVHPFASDDPLLGMAVAEELAASFSGVDLLLGPEVTAGAVPPIMAGGGFIGLTRVTGQEPMYGAAGVDLLRGALGVDVVVTGRVLVVDEGYRLLLAVAGPTGVTTATVEAPHARRDRLVSQAARVVAHAEPTLPKPAPPAAPSLDGAYATYVTALVYASGGLVSDATALLATVADVDLPERAVRLREDLAAASEPATAEPVSSGTRLLRRALLQLGVDAFDEDATFAAFRAAAAVTRRPVAGAWAAVLAASLGDYATARAELAGATGEGGYPYGEALGASLAWAEGDDEGALAGVRSVIGGRTDDRSAALLGASLVAQLVGSAAEETAALGDLARLSPFLVYSFERLSFLAFDRDDALAAAEALAPAVELDPESDLYWTNLGWAYYLLGFLERSEAASLQAVALDANQYIALYNIGLVRSVSGRLVEADDAYARATRLDPAIDDEAVKDLEDALVAYPDAVGVSYSLARLYEAEGRRDDAKVQYGRFVELAGEDPALAGPVSAARERLAALDAPPPPLELSGAVEPRLGARGTAASPYHPGDRVFPSFEVSTPGDQLPARLTVGLTLLSERGVGLAEGGDEVVVPSGAVGFVIDSLYVDLPSDLPEGNYVLRVDVSARDGSSTSGSAELIVRGGIVVLRQLISRGVVMTALDSGAPLYDAKSLTRAFSLTDTLMGELAGAASAADEALPTVTTGRFAGKSGAQLFEGSTAADIDAYLGYLIASGVADYRFVFVDAYAAWALDGAPAAP